MTDPLPEIEASLEARTSNTDAWKAFHANAPENIRWLVAEVKRLRERLRVYASAHYEAPR